MKAERDIRITDPNTRRIVEMHRIRRGDKSSAKTARDLIRERVVQLEGGTGDEIDHSRLDDDGSPHPKATQIQTKQPVSNPARV